MARINAAFRAARAPRFSPFNVLIQYALDYAPSLTAVKKPGGALRRPTHPRESGRARIFKPEGNFSSGERTKCERSFGLLGWAQFSCLPPVVADTRNSTLSQTLSRSWWRRLALPQKSFSILSELSCRPA